MGPKLHLHATLALVLAVLTHPATASEIKDSILNIPVSLDINALEELANQELPETLETINQSGKTCVKAKWLKTKGLPSCKLKGIKLYCKDTWIKTKTTPSVKCDVSGWVKRDGRITVVGTGAGLQLNIPLKARVTARGRGDIGKNIRQTANAAANIQVATTIDVAEDWTVRASTSASHTWTKRPTLKLFNLIPVTIGNKVDPAFKKALRNLEAKANEYLSGSDTGLDLKKVAQKAWSSLYQPIELSDSNLINLEFDASEVAYSGFTFSNKSVSTILQMKGRLHQSPGHQAHRVIPPLPNLSRVSVEDDESRVYFPIAVSLASVQATGNKKLNDLGWVQVDEEEIQGSVKFSDLEVITEEKRIRFTFDVEFDDKKNFFDTWDFADLFDLSGRYSLIGKFYVDQGSNRLGLKDIEFGTAPGEPLEIDKELLFSLLEVDELHKELSKALSYDFSKDIESLKEEVTTIGLADKVHAFGNVKLIGLGSPIIESDKITIPVSIVATSSVTLTL